MSKKRRSDATRLDEVEKTMYSTFRSTANSLSQMYTQAMNQQRVAFQAGERHALEKLYQWILRQHDDGSRVIAADIVAYLQNKIDYGGEDSSTSPELPLPHQHPQSTMHFTNSGIQTYGLSGQATVGPAPETSQNDQTKNSVFSNASSCPDRWNLQPYHLAQGGGYFPSGAFPTGFVAQGGGYFPSGAFPTGFVARNHEGNIPSQNRDPIPFHANDSSMDMHADSLLHEFY